MIDTDCIYINLTTVPHPNMLQEQKSMSLVYIHFEKNDSKMAHNEPLNIMWTEKPLKIHEH